MTDTASTIKALEHGRKTLARPFGWCKGRSKNVTFFGLITQHCATGSVDSFFHDNLTREQTVAAVEALIGTIKLWRKKNPWLDNSVAGYNDRDETRKSDILRLFDETIERLKNEMAVESH